MTTSPSSSDYTDTEDGDVWEFKSDLSLSVGYFPYDDPFSYEDPTSYEDTTSVDSPVHFLPPVQGKGWTKSSRLVKRRDQIEDDPGQFCKLRITLAWDIDVGPDQADPAANWNLNRDHHWMDKWPQEQTKLTPCKLDDLTRKFETFLEDQNNDKNDDSLFTESRQEKDFQLSTSSLSHMAQLSHKEHDACQVLPKCKPPENKKVIQLPEISPRSKKHELLVNTMMPHRKAKDSLAVSQATGNQRTSTTETSSISAEQPEEDTLPDTHIASCLNLRRAFHWLRQHVLASLKRRKEHADKDQTRWYQKILKSHPFRSNTIMPQECLDS